MATCDPCSDASISFTELYEFRQSILIALCRLVKYYSPESGFTFTDLAEKAHGDIGAAYASVCAENLPSTRRQVILQNLTDGDVLVSLDGTNDHFTLATGTERILDMRGATCFTNVWVKNGASAPTAGSFFVSSY